ncbi:MAG: hypothetical protein LIO53_02695 [Oscillospiraceae bacterium]|nr:hypothetical protein [Oscillospiraceae bacterium]
MYKEEIFETIEIDEKVTDRIIFNLEQKNSEYRRLSSLISDCLDDMREVLDKGEEFTPDLYYKIRGCVETVDKVRMAEFAAMYLSGAADAFKMLERLGYIKD